MLKRILLVMLLGQMVVGLAGNNEIFRRKKYPKFRADNSKTYISVTRANQNQKAKNAKNHKKACAKASTWQECGAATAVMGGFVAYGAFITWMAFNSSSGFKMDYT